MSRQSCKDGLGAARGIMQGLLIELDVALSYFVVVNLWRLF